MRGVKVKMERYAALLRGINISGKNKIAMNELKSGFEKLNYSDVVTYINSGNVVFSTELSDEEKLAADISAMIRSEFSLDIPIAVISLPELSEILMEAPEWWGNDDKEIYDNLIFIIPPATFEEVYGEIGEARQEYEKIQNYKGVIFWSFVRKCYSKTNWVKTASSKINDKITIRTANTVRKLLNM